jgi:hypothetical protein
VYTLPTNFKDIEDKIKVENQADFVNTVQNISNPLSRRRFYIWNIDSSELGSPAVLPELPVKKSVSSTTASRDSKNTDAIKYRDDYRCRCCGFQNRNGIQVCHIFDINEINNCSKSKKLEKLKEVGLTNINDSVNLISLCYPCHTLFDKDQLMISPFDVTWAVDTSIAGDVSSTGVPYSRFHGSPLELPVSLPKKLLMHRLNSRKWVRGSSKIKISQSILTDVKLSGDYQISASSDLFPLISQAESTGIDLSFSETEIPLSKSLESMSLNDNLTHKKGKSRIKKNK